MMFGKLLPLLIKQCKPRILYNSQRNISALYLTGDKAKNTYAVLTPYMDFEEIFNDLERNLKSRNINVNFNEITEKYEIFKNTKNDILNLEIRRQNIAKILKYGTDEDQQEKEKLKDEGKRIREEVKSLKHKLYAIEDDFIIKFLTLPNSLHEQTPIEYPKLLYRKGIPEINKITKSTKSIIIDHLERKDLIEYTDKYNYYLLNEAARFDWEFPYNCIKYFLKKNFIQTVNPDFGKSVLIEAALIDKSSLEEVIEEEAINKMNALYLTGGGSLIGYLGYIAKLSLFPSVLPLRFISSGRQYSHTTDKELRGLCSTIQSNVIQTFIATETYNEANNELETILNLIVDLYKELDLNFQIEYLTAKELQPAESLRASIKVYFPSMERYIEIGHISHYKTFISKRLLFNVRKPKEYVFPNIIGGTVVDVTKLIACLIENDKELKTTSYVKSNVEMFTSFVS